MLILSRAFLSIRWRRYVIRIGQPILATFQQKMTETWAVDYFLTIEQGNSITRKGQLAVFIYILHLIFFSHDVAQHTDRRSGFFVIIGLDHRHWTCLIEEENDVRVYF